jgi:hypothetical protein
LLEHGLSHRQVVIVLYAVSAVFALLSLFLLWPTGSTLGLVLAVLGTGIWFGVQRLGYLEFGELRRVAQRTMEQPQIFVNNLAIRRATEELKMARDYDQLGRILSAAFSSNDFDAFDLYWFVEPGEWREIRRGHETDESESTPCLRWKRPGSAFTHGSGPAWSLTLDLVTGNKCRRGSMTIHRRYSDTALQIDVNLLTSDFPLALAEALDRLLQQTANQASSSSERGGFMAAHAG